MISSFLLDDTGLHRNEVAPGAPVPERSLWIDLLDALPGLADANNLARIPKALPVYVLAGSADPVNGNLKGLHMLVRDWNAAGLRDITWKVYDGGRHEMLNETNRAEVLDDLERWLDRVAPAPKENA